MKKALSVFLCYAISMSVSVADPLRTMNFENSKLWDKRPTFGLDDNGQEKSGVGTYWYFAGEDIDNASLIRAYTDDEEPYDNFDFTSGNPKPDYMKAGTANRGVLSIAAAYPLHRTFSPISNETGPTKEQCMKVSDTEGVYIDTLVQFTLANDREDPFEVMSDGAKLSCRLCRTSLTDATPQFVVTAGCLKNGALSFTNYVTTAKVTDGKWYRLTAKMVTNASLKYGTQLAAFALYIDGKPVTCAEGEYVIGEGAESLFAGNEFYENRALFLSLQRYGGATYADRLYSLGLYGTGMADEIAVTEENPFSTGGYSVDVLVVCEDEKIEKLTCEITEVTGEVTTKVFTGAISGSTFSVNPETVVRFIPEAKDSYGFESQLVVSGNISEKTIAEVEGYTIKFSRVESFSDTSRVIVSIPSKNVYFSVGDVDYSTFNEAVAVASTNDEHLVNLRYPITLSRESSDDGQAWVLPGQEVTLDLCGNSIKGDHMDDEAAIYNQGRLTVIDSVGGGVIEAPGTAIEIVRDNTALENKYNPDTCLKLGSDESQSFTVKGRVKVTPGRGTLQIFCGDYLNPSEASTTEFYLAPYLADERITADPTTIDGLPGFTVANLGNSRMVRFTVPYAGGKAVPDRERIDYGEKATPAEATAPGYRFVKWTLNGVAYDFNTPVTKTINLAADMLCERYTIEHDGDARIPSDYSVEDAYTELRKASRAFCRFDGWVDKNTGYGVTAIGEGAKFDGTDLTVCGNLDLVAQWTPQQIRWENTCHRLAESNGTYRGEWKFQIPVDGSYTEGMKIKINQIDLGVVNPAEYPRTAECLSVAVDGGETVLSQPRTYELDPETKAYIVGTNRLMNGRAKVSYRFDNLVITVGKENYISLANGDGSKAEGCLVRFARTTDLRYTLIGNCDPSEDASPIIRYREFCPLYEIYGEAVLTDDE